LASRASRLGGTFEVSPSNGADGTRLEWRVPLG
jgi:signal transduction histidine kinase